VIGVLRALKRAGYPVGRTGRSGYKIDAPRDALTAEVLRPHLTTRKVGVVLHVVKRTPSTNDLAAEIAGEACPDGTVIVADEQSRGRGRLGRSWFSPAGRGLYFSVVLRPGLPAAEAPVMTLVTAVAIAEGIRDRTGLAPDIKWPNDILFGKRKVAGILTELATQGDQVAHVVVGVGLNVRGTRTDFPRSLRPVATTLEVELGRAPERAPLLVALLARLDQRYVEFVRRGPGPSLSRWRTFARFLSKRVRLTAPGGEVVEGVAVDIDPHGALIVRGRSGALQRVLAGDLEVL
jgi:BirA family biotin operon repressor/biotin-[acetyl-CoA-carboxylase] ligase